MKRASTGSMYDSSTARTAGTAQAGAACSPAVSQREHQVQIAALLCVLGRSLPPGPLRCAAKLCFTVLLELLTQVAPHKSRPNARTHTHIYTHVQAHPYAHAHARTCRHPPPPTTCDSVPVRCQLAGLQVQERRHLLRRHHAAARLDVPADLHRQPRGEGAGSDVAGDGMHHPQQHWRGMSCWLASRQAPGRRFPGTIASVLPHGPPGQNLPKS